MSSGPSSTKTAMAVTLIRTLLWKVLQRAYRPSFSSPQALVSGIVGWFHDHPLVPGYNNECFLAMTFGIHARQGQDTWGRLVAAYSSSQSIPKAFRMLRTSTAGPVKFLNSLHGGS